tara:strand:+ start:421 stop:621 length:201 start_codon:yes stop_codon:yes gene_type:complete
MSRYTEYLKEKVICLHCQTIVSRGYIEKHKKTSAHLENIKKHVEPLKSGEYSSLSYSTNDGKSPSL